MSGVLSTLPRRLFAACAFAAVAIALLSLLVERFEEPPKKTMRGEDSAAAAAGGAHVAVGQPNAAPTRAGDSGGGAIEAATAAIEPLGVAAGPAGEVAWRRARRGRAAGGLGTSDAVLKLQPPVGRIAVARRLASLSPEIAPVVEILPSGRFALRRSAPLPSGPAAALRPAGALGRNFGSGYGAGIVLPGGSLASLTPDARGALLKLLSRWLLIRPAPVGRLEPIDLTWAPSSLRQLLSWLP